MKLQMPSKGKVLRDARNFCVGSVLCVVFLFLLDRMLGTVCWLRLACGFPCPLCGITRAMMLFLKGDIVGAWQMNAMFYLVLLFVPIYVFFKYFVENGSKIIKAYVIIFIVIAFGYYVYRMLYWFPKQEPMLYDSDNWLNYIRKLLEVKGN